MKANELMLDDWIKYGNRFAIIKELYNGYVIILCSINGQHEYVQETYDNIEDIPLTHEILEKIGFETQPNIGYIIDDYDGTQIIYDSWNHNLRIIKDYKTCLDIETFNDLTLRELQHALRICGIRKEIVL